MMKHEKTPTHVYIDLVLRTALPRLPRIPRPMQLHRMGETCLSTWSESWSSCFPPYSEEISKALELNRLGGRYPLMDSQLPSIHHPPDTYTWLYIIISLPEYHSAAGRFSLSLIFR